MSIPAPFELECPLPNDGGQSVPAPACPVSVSAEPSHNGAPGQCSPHASTGADHVVVPAWMRPDLADAAAAFDAAEAAELAADFVADNGEDVDVPLPVAVSEDRAYVRLALVRRWSQLEPLLTVEQLATHVELAEREVGDDR